MKHPHLAVEPLPEEVWNRIESRVLRAVNQAPAPASQGFTWSLPRWWMFAVPTLAAAAAVGLVLQNPRESAEPVATAAPDAQTPATSTASAERWLRSQDTPLDFEFDGSAVHLSPHSELLIAAHTARGYRLTLQQGEAGFSVAHQPLGSDFVVEAGRTRVRVVGTEFTVQREGDHAQVAVRKGAVEVQEDGTRQLLGPGDRWPAAVGETEPRHARKLPNAGGQSASNERERYVRAATLEKTDPARAEALYRSLANGSGSWAANGLYALAILELDRGRPSRSRTHLKEYLRRFPTGENAGDARQLLEDIPAQQNTGSK
jgi:hypothetical protein